MSSIVEMTNTLGMSITRLLYITYLFLRNRYKAVKKFIPQQPPGCEDINFEDNEVDDLKNR